MIFRTPDIGTALRLYASGNDGSAHPTGQIATGNRSNDIDKAFLLKEARKKKITRKHSYLCHLQHLILEHARLVISFVFPERPCYLVL